MRAPAPGPRGGGARSWRCWTRWACRAPFAIGEDLRRTRTPPRDARAPRGRHEVASHSHAHDYALYAPRPCRHPDDLQRADAILAATVSGPRASALRATRSTRTSTRPPRPWLPVRLRPPFPPRRTTRPRRAVMGALALAGGCRACAGYAARAAGARVPYRPDPARPYQRGSGPWWSCPWR